MDQGLKDDLEVGTLFRVQRQLEQILQPKTKQFLGHAIDQVGLVKIIAAQENNATARVEKSCYEIKIGDFLLPYEKEPIPLFRYTELPDLDRYLQLPAGMRSGKDNAMGTIIYSEDLRPSFGKGRLVSIDIGITQNIVPGEFFTSIAKTPDKTRSLLPEPAPVSTPVSSRFLLSVSSSSFSIPVSSLITPSRDWYEQTLHSSTPSSHARLLEPHTVTNTFKGCLSPLPPLPPKAGWDTKYLRKVLYTM